MKTKTSLALFLAILGTSVVWFGSEVVNADNSLTSVFPSAQPRNIDSRDAQASEQSQDINADLAVIKAGAEQVARTVNRAVSQTIKSAKAEAGLDSGLIESTPAPALVTSARKQIGVTVTYDPAYVGLDFPMGDVPMDRGVCTDVIIRAYRQQGKDLQALVNTDMKKAWSQYPKIWGLKTTDKNIDHRRVPNLRVFFKRHGKSLGVSQQASDYKAGDLVTWNVGGKLPHIGIVSNKTTATGTPLIIHNIGAGTQEEDILFSYPITGHYRY